MNSDTADYTKGFYNPGFNLPEIKPKENKATLLDSLSLIVSNIKEEQDEKTQTIEVRHEWEIRQKDKIADDLIAKVRKLHNILELIPDVAKYLQEHRFSAELCGIETINLAKEWIEMKLREENQAQETATYPDQSLANEISNLDNIINELQEKLSHVENKTVDTKIMQIRDGKKLIAFDKAKKQASGSLVNVVIPVPDGCQIETIILKKVGK